MATVQQLHDRLVDVVDALDDEVRKNAAAIAGKVDAVVGKGLSANDYTDEDKAKVAGIEAGANNYVLPTATTSTFGGVKVGAGLQIKNTALELYSSDGGLPPSAPWVTSTLVYHIRGKQGIISFSTTFTTATAIANAGWQELSSGSLTGARLKPLCDAYSLGFLIRAGNICEAVPLKVTSSDGKLYFFAHANFSVAAHEIFAGTYMWAIN